MTQPRRHGAGARAAWAAGLAMAATALVVAATPAGGTPTAAVGDCVADPSWGTPNGSLASQLVGAINGYRTSHGLNALAVAPSLAKAAYWKAMHMAWLRYIAADDRPPPIARTVAQRLEACGYPAGSHAYGQAQIHFYKTAQGVLDAWLGMPAQKEKLDNPSFTLVGTGIAVSSENGTYYWTATFGTPTDGSQPPPPPPPPPPPGPPPPPPPPPAPPPPPPPPSPPLPPAPPPPGPPPPPSPSPAPPPPPPSGGGGVTAPPTITLTSVAPDGASTQATFVWVVTGFGTISWCTLDATPEAPCASPRTWKGLAAGRHTLRIDARSRIGSASVSHSWTVTGAGSGSGGGQPGSPPSPPSGGRPLEPPPASADDVHALSATRFTLSPSRVRSGGFATARVTIATDNGLGVARDGRVTCNGKAGAKRAKLVHRQIAALTRATALVTCRWAIPPRTKGRTFRATLALAVGPLRASRTVSRRIR